MSIIFLPWRNVRANPGRSAALGVFIAISGMLLVLAHAFLGTITGNMERSLIDSLTGDLQARAGSSQEADMFSLRREWDKLPPLTAAQAAMAEQAFAQAAPGATLARRVRSTVLLANGGLQDFGMLIGLDPAGREYQQAMTILQGRGLDPSRPGEILISQSQAENLQVKVGDQITVMVPGAGAGTGGPITATVAGIGEISLLSMFDTFYNYTDLGAAQQLLGYGDGQVTDVITFLPPGQDAAALAPVVQDRASGDVRMTTREGMGGFILGGIALYGAMFYGFVAVLALIVGLLIMNLITMVGVERRREIGTLRALGYSRRTIVGLFLGEIAVTGTLFGALGVLAGIAVARVLAGTTLHPSPPLDFIMGKAFVLQVEPADALLPFGLIVLFTCLAAVWPAYRAASLRPVELMAES